MSEFHAAPFPPYLSWGGDWNLPRGWEQVNKVRGLPLRKKPPATQNCCRFPTKVRDFLLLSNKTPLNRKTSRCQKSVPEPPFLWGSGLFLAPQASRTWSSWSSPEHRAILVWPFPASVRST